MKNKIEQLIQQEFDKLPTITNQREFLNFLEATTPKQFAEIKESVNDIIKAQKFLEVL